MVNACDVCEIHNELNNAPEWDGHKPEDIERLYSLLS